MRIALLSVLLINTWAVSAFCQEPVRVKTEVGKEVILNADGTWKYVVETPSNSTLRPRFNKPAGANKVFKSDRGGFNVLV